MTHVGCMKNTIKSNSILLVNRIWYKKFTFAKHRIILTISFNVFKIGIYLFNVKTITCFALLFKSFN